MEKFDGPAVLNEFEELFGPIDERKLRFILKCVKHCRLRCRSNAALYNWVSRSFPYTCRDVPVEGKDYSRMVIESKY